ncbi:MAG TPA: copper resistance CopC family protein [Ramlibacter sp.]|nr:copper resistance CopC family protein [Ramlibacter sp.]
MNWPRAFALVLATLVAAHAQAHAFLDRAEPRVGATVQAAPAQLKLWFTQEIEPAFSTVKVIDSGGRRVDKSDAQVDPARRDLLRVSLGTLGTGDYTVVWRVVSTDSHVTEGDFVFHVGK